MFTGIVEELGEVVVLRELPVGARLTVASPLVTSDAALGDSIAVNGVCLTVVDVSGSRFTVDVVHETLRRSNLGQSRVGDRVNLERAVAVDRRLGGHVMQGHVDGTGTLVARDEGGLTRFAVPEALSRYVVEKGSIAVDGVSLTVVDVQRDWFTVALIPITLASTTLGIRQPGDSVNLEVDVLAKYVEKLAAPYLCQRREDNGQGGDKTGD